MARARPVIIGLALLALVHDGSWAQQSTTRSPHGRSTGGRDCSACHSPDGWKPAKAKLDFDHNDASFVLLGQHDRASCTSCHLDLRFDRPKFAPTDCGSCHVDVHQGRLSDACGECHSTVSFSDVSGLAVHSKTSFPLAGTHLQLSCESCHSSDQGGSFSSLSSDCYSCHAEQYERAETIDHPGLGFPTDCAQCHNSLVWGGGDPFDHITASDGFALVGAHTSLACSSCHNAPSMELHFPEPSDRNDCLACHQQDYDRQHAGTGFQTACLDCHSNVTWEDATFDHLATSGFALVGAHTSLGCATCHAVPGMELVYPPPSSATDCVACHQDDYDRQHAGSGYPTACIDCHGNTTWLDATFDHLATSGFALVGAHTSLDCATCHAVPGMELLYPPPAGPTDCVACHQDDYDRQHAGSGYPTTCLECHGNTTWLDASFDHLTASGFALVGAHTSLDCATCHALPGMELLYPPPSSATDCVACHQDEYDRRHASSGYPTNCLECHDNTTWLGATFDHLAVSGFDLTGAHGLLDCATCHALPGMELLYPPPSGPTDCVACHQDEYDRQHAGSGYPTTCLECHGNSTWLDATFDHLTASGFALVGAHTALDCATCHAVPGMELLYPLPSSPTDCVACHQDEYDRQHAGSGYPTACIDCHGNTTWLGATFDHLASSGFDLTGAHSLLSCGTCHALPGMELLYPPPSGPTDCVACHQDEYDRQHAGSGYPTTCLECHGNTTWLGATFDHLAVSGFELTGAHGLLDCATCHALPGMELLYPPPASPSDCIACHQDEYDRQHAASGYPTACLDCHGNTTWLGATFDHTATSGFDLIGAHTSLDCATCHALPGMELLYPPPSGPTDCIACHQDEYDRQHAASGYPTSCLDCHGNTTWLGATFDHLAVSGFDLSGAHSLLDCATCHALPGMELLYPPPSSPSDCIACHQDEYDRRHAGSGFPTTCLECHSNSTWLGATFDHLASSGFDLSGAHSLLDCASCHALPGMELLYPPPSGPSDCIACHQDEYDRQHAASGYPTSCLDCHDNTTWFGATFQHTAFPIYSGRHSGAWGTCETCHTDRSNFSVFTCFNCHQHEQTRMDQKHSGRNGYIYDSNACYSCHSDGRA